MSACQGPEEILCIPAGPKTRCYSKQPPLETHDNVPSYIHPIIPPPKNEVQSWENKIGLPHREPTISGGMCLTLPNGAVNGHWLPSFLEVEILLPSSHRLGEIKTCGGSGVSLKPQPPVCLSQRHHMPQGILLVLNVRDKTGQAYSTHENKPSGVHNRPNQEVRVFTVSPTPLTTLPLKSHEQETLAGQHWMLLPNPAITHFKVQAKMQVSPRPPEGAVLWHSHCHMNSEPFEDVQDIRK